MYILVKKIWHPKHCECMANEKNVLINVISTYIVSGLITSRCVIRKEAPFMQVYEVPDLLAVDLCQDVLN